MEKEIFFFIGTEAELIKIFPVILSSIKKEMICHIIASGQNDLTKSRVMQEISLNGIFLELSKERDIEKSAKGLLKWFVKTRKSAIKNIETKFSINTIKGSPMIVHGDTVSTFMGALIGKQLHMRVCHVEAGLRSHHLLNPFPEEIDRLLTSRIASVHFAPGDEAVKNLIHAKGKIINTQYNTLIDSLLISRSMPVITDLLETVIPQDYFVFVMHRQENLMNKEFLKQIITCIEEMAKRKKCVLILHQITENVLREMKILQKLQDSPDFILFRRVDYFDFMKMLDHAKYVITDGGSNQEELYYMGKPCLIMRKTTERKEGIGQNARMFSGDVKELLNFADTYVKMQIEPITASSSPSEIIAEVLAELIK